MNKIQKFMKTKKGFTLVELIVVIAVLSILIAVAVPVYNLTQRKSRIDICETTRLSIDHDLSVWAMQHPYNDSLSFKIESDGNNGTISDVKGGPADIANMSDTLTSEIFKDGVPHCPCKEGTYTITCAKSTSRKYFTITIVCDGGTDGNTHN